VAGTIPGDIDALRTQLARKPEAGGASDGDVIEVQAMRIAPALTAIVFIVMRFMDKFLSLTDVRRSW
jgi:hypothetical protein